jgi:uncharacterized protein YjiS (DUF1127 family)
MSSVAFETALLPAQSASTGLNRRSTLVQRLLRATNDPVKQNVRKWLSAMRDERLFDFGLSKRDIADLRDRPTLG